MVETMIILDNTKSLSVLANDSTNGLGQLNVLTAFCDEELNGIYEVELTVSTKEKYFSLLSIGSILKIKLDAIRGEQLFRVYFISKPINEIATVKLQHISYDCSKISIAPFESTGAVASVNGLLSHMIGSYPFTLTTNIENTTSNFKLDIPRSFRECLGGYEGSLLDTFRGEYEWDNLTIRMLARRGSDNGVRIAYGKNLTDFNQEENNENTYDGVLGYAVVDEVTYTASTYYNKTGATNPRILNVDFSSDYESGEVPTSADLLAKATTYATNNNIEVPNVNITISFVPLWQTEEYKNIAPLERVNLGDTVHVFFDKLNVEASSRVVKTRWNIVSEKYDEIELGSTKANLNTVLNETSEQTKKEIMKEVDDDNGFIVEELEGLADLITNGLGLFVTKNVLIDGSMRIVLHNKPTVADSDVLYYIGANGLVVSTDGGSTWNAGFNPDGSAYFNALSANIIRALQIYGSFLRFGDESSNYIDVAPYSINNVPQGVSFDGTGYVRFRPQESFIVNNIDSNQNILNTFVMGAEDVDNNINDFIHLRNYDSGNHLLANAIEMNAPLVDSVSGRDYNRLVILNKNTSTQAELLSNQIELYSMANERRMSLENYSIDGGHKANYIQFKAQATSDYLIFNNFKINSDTIASQIQLRSTTLSSVQTNNVSIINNNHSTNNTGNRILMQASAEVSQVNYDNYMANANTLANSITMFHNVNSGVRSLSLYNYDANNYASNIIQLGSTDGIKVWAKEDNINISASPSMSTQSGSGNITIGALNNIVIFANEKLYLQGREIYIDSSNYVRARAL